MNMRWYADNSELIGIRESAIPDILLFGGFTIGDDQERIIRESIESIKEGRFGVRRAPIKWNFKDLRDFYKKKNKQKLFESMLQSSKEWREEIIDRIKEHDIVIVISCLQTYSIRRDVIKDLKGELSGYAFSNGLMRFAMIVKESTATHAQVILDWPDKGDSVPFNREYAFAFNTGKSWKGLAYYSGPLKDISFTDSIFYSNMKHTTLLQVADIILGATREFIEYALEKRPAGIGVKSTIKLRSRFLGWPKNIFGRGINIYGDEQFEEKIGLAIDKYLINETVV